jgi:hypothetical protein
MRSGLSPDHDWLVPPEWEHVRRREAAVLIPDDPAEAAWLTNRNDPTRLVAPFGRLVGPAIPHDAGQTPSFGERRDRKCRLLACAAARGVLHLVPGTHGQPYRDVVAVAERFADRGATEEELAAAFRAALDVDDCEDEGCGGWRHLVYGRRRASRAARALGWRRRRRQEVAREVAMLYAMHAAAGTAFRPTPSAAVPLSVVEVMRDAVEAAWAEAAAAHPIHNVRGDNSGTRRMSARLCDFIRDIFGNPFRPVEFKSAWRTSTAALLARGMYESRDFSAMPILADALQDAGCTDDVIREHCQQPDQHVHGCWVIDLVLRKA